MNFKPSRQPFGIGFKFLAIVLPLVLLGDVIFTAVALRTSRAYLLQEKEYTLLSFNRTVALDIVRGYDISNTRSLYSLLFELKNFDSRIVTMTVYDSSGTITADLEAAKLFHHDTSAALAAVLRNALPAVQIDDAAERATIMVPIKNVASARTVGVLKMTVSIEDIFAVLRSLEILLFITSVAVFVAVGVGVLFYTRKIVVHPLHRILPVLSKIQNGDFSQSVPVESSDEIGILSEHVNTMTEGLREREYVKDVFSKYVPKEVVDRLLEQRIRPHLEGEAREVTVVFADLRGFTRMTEQLGAEQIVTILNRFFTAMTDVVLEYEGMIDKFSGDEIMIVFGAPIQGKEDAVSAVRMALAMQKRLQVLNREFSSDGITPLQMGIGIATGTAIAGNIGSVKRLNYSIIGDVVNLASRLTGKARGGDIAVSASTYEIIKHTFQCSTMGQVEVKGKAKPVEIYLVHDAFV